MANLSQISQELFRLNGLDFRCTCNEPDINVSMYRMRAIIICGLYTFYPHFEVHLCTVTFGLMYGLYSRAVSNQVQVIVARVQYMFCNKKTHHPCHSEHQIWQFRCQLVRLELEACKLFQSQEQWSE